jgi:hypothetical protein
VKTLYATFLLTVLTATSALAYEPSPQVMAPRNKEQCIALFHQLNVSVNGRLTSTEAASSHELAQALSDPQLWRKGYITEDQFLPVCTGQQVAK